MKKILNFLKNKRALLLFSATGIFFGFVFVLSMGILLPKNINTNPIPVSAGGVFTYSHCMSFACNAWNGTCGVVCCAGNQDTGRCTVFQNGRWTTAHDL